MVLVVLQRKICRCPVWQLRRHYNSHLSQQQLRQIPSHCPDCPCRCRHPRFLWAHRRLAIHRYRRGTCIPDRRRRCRQRAGCVGVHHYRVSKICSIGWAHRRLRIDSREDGIDGVNSSITPCGVTVMIYNEILHSFSLPIYRGIGRSARNSGRI